MTNLPLLLPLLPEDPLAGPLAAALGAELGHMEFHRFPDGESYLRHPTPPAGRPVVILCTLDRPDPKALPLLFTARAARELGACHVGLVAPYLAYMRQDRRFREGEAVTSAHFARLLAAEFDWLATVDPHLHRRGALSEIYAMPAVAAHAAPLLSAWISREVPHPIVIGPDAESEQWAAEVARGAGAPHLVLEKTRRGDREVEVSVPQLAAWQGRTPVLVDDIISTGRTMVETLRHLARAGTPAPVCLAVHAVFAERAYAELLGAGAARVATCNTIPHATNALDVTSLLAAAALEAMQQAVGPGLNASKLV